MIANHVLWIMFHLNYMIIDYIVCQLYYVIRSYERAEKLLATRPKAKYEFSRPHECDSIHNFLNFSSGQNRVSPDVNENVIISSSKREEHRKYNTMGGNLTTSSKIKSIDSPSDKPWENTTRWKTFWNFIHNDFYESPNFFLIV